VKLQNTSLSEDSNMKNEKKFCITLPMKMHEQIWKRSGRFKMNLVAESLLIEFLVDPDLQKKVQKRIREGFKRK
jgi:hypothetical protein